MPLATTIESASQTGDSSSIILAVAALAISLFGAWTTWRIHRESGGRVEIEMTSALYRPRASGSELHTNDTSHRVFKSAPDRPLIEMCQVVIQNGGRTGVTVTKVQLRAEYGSSALGRFTPRAFIWDSQPGQKISGETYFRIDPYDQRSLLFDYWSVVDHVFESNPALSELTLSAEVTVAGHPHPRSSKKGRGGWRMARGQVSHLGTGEKRRARNAFLLEMLRNHNSRLSLTDELEHIATNIESRLVFPATEGDWLTAISTELATFEGQQADAEMRKQEGYNGNALLSVARELGRQPILRGAETEPARQVSSDGNG